MIKFGVPTKERVVKQEKYPNTPVLTVNPAPEQKGGAYKFEMNPEAANLVGLDGNGGNISLAFVGGSVYLGVEGQIPAHISDQWVRVTKTNTFSSSRFHTFLCKFMDVSPAVHNEFVMSAERVVIDEQGTEAVVYKLEYMGLVKDAEEEVVQYMEEEAEMESALAANDLVAEVEDTDSF